MFNNAVILALVFSLARSTHVLSQCKPRNNDSNRQQKVRTVREIEYEWAKAYTNRDLAALKCILANDFQIGRMPDKKDEVNNKQHVLDWVRTRTGSAEIDQLQVKLVGEGAIGRGIYTVRGTDEKVKARYQFLDMFIYRDKRWQAILRQIAELPLD